MTSWPRWPDATAQILTPNDVNSSPSRKLESSFVAQCTQQDLRIYEHVYDAFLLLLYFLSVTLQFLFIRSDGLLILNIKDDPQNTQAVMTKCDKLPALFHWVELYCALSAELNEPRWLLQVVFSLSF